MIPYDLDPSLHTGEPEPPTLDDGFSAPHHVKPPDWPDRPPQVPAEPRDAGDWVKSAF